MDLPDRIGIVGGGVVGLAAAYTLATLPPADGAEATDVVLFERDALGAGSTTRAGCGLRTFFDASANARLAEAGLSFWRRAEALLDTDVAFREHGYAFLTADADTTAGLRRRVRRRRAFGDPARRVPPAVVADRLPGLAVDRYSAAALAPTAALAAPDRMVAGLADAARAAGATLHTDTPVEDLARTADGVRVTTPDRLHRFDAVVNAAGAWAPAIAALVDDHLPVRPVRRRIVALDVAAPDGLPMTVDLDTGFYLLPGPDGRVLAGGHFADRDAVVDPDAPAAFDTGRDPDYETRLFEHGRACTDLLADATVAESWTGLYAMTDSRVPVIEAADGIVHVTGFSGHGIMQAPGAAQVVAELLAGEAPTLVDAAALRRSRPHGTPDLQF